MKKAIQACNGFLQKNPDADLSVTFGVPDDSILALGQQTREDMLPWWGRGIYGERNTGLSQQGWLISLER